MSYNTRHNLLAVAIVGAALGGWYFLHSLNGVMLVIMLVGAYFAPTLIANHRKVPNQGSVLVVNLFLGWTFIGWVAALAMAARSRTLPVAAELETTR